MDQDDEYTVMSLCPVSGETEWEVLVAEDANKYNDEIVVVVQLVLAWGLTRGGSVIPITATWRDGIYGDRVALRRVGIKKVWGLGREFKDLDEWEDVVKSRLHMEPEVPLDEESREDGDCG